MTDEDRIREKARIADRLDHEWYQSHQPTRAERMRLPCQLGGPCDGCKWCRAATE